GTALSRPRFMPVDYLSLVVVGLALGKQFSVSDSMQALPVVTVRQVAIPLLVWVLLGFTTLTSITKSVLFIESLMPSAVLTVVYASDFRLDAQIAATIVTIGTVLLLPFLPLIPFILSFI
ncbi:MAG: AEC family transporter, partial [Promethearchaeati archaeon]